MSSKILVLYADKEFGEQLRNERKRLNISQTKLADTMGMPYSNVCHFEKSDPSYGKAGIKVILRYAKALGYKELKFKL